MQPYVGTSGYYYDDWREKFYPVESKKRDWLRFYAEHFKTVELNTTFYHTPRKSSLEKWAFDTPPHFRFTLKGSRYVTHQKKLKDPETTTSDFYRAVAPLAEKTDCVLWQLPGSFHFNADRLENFAKACSTDFVNVVEFRHATWFVEPCFEILRKYRLAFCMISAPAELPERALQTRETAYLRFHGKQAGHWYNYLYSPEELELWVKKIRELDPQKIFIYFNNDIGGHAIQNAGMLDQMLKR